ncbi:MAG: serpin family protein [archaeon]
MKKIVFVLIVLTMLLFFGCVGEDDELLTPEDGLLIPPTVESPLGGLIEFKKFDDSKSTSEGLETIVLANNQFGVDYYNKLSDEQLNKNILFSPFSISTALAMTYEGADGLTAKEMRDVLYYPEDDLVRRSSFAKLFNLLSESANKLNYELSVSNTLWNEKTYEFKKSFYDVINNYYYAKSTPVDFINYPEEQRELINDWVEENTKSKIKDILPEKSITDETKLVLANAIYFKGSWLNEFDSAKTTQKDFFTNGEEKISVLMMQKEEELDYFEDEEFQYLKLPYEGEDISMTILLPREIKTNFDIPSAKDLMDLNQKMVKEKVIVNLPKFKFEAEYKLKEDLEEMGLREAFTDFANFSKMDEINYVKIDEVYHKAFIEVNESGAEASAATVVVIVQKTSVIVPQTFNANHSFAFYISDDVSGEILFMGKVINPNL